MQEFKEPPGKPLRFGAGGLVGTTALKDVQLVVEGWLRNPRPKWTQEAWVKTFRWRVDELRLGEQVANNDAVLGKIA
jgi:hypothetical protein